jgi:hypothetical protein
MLIMERQTYLVTLVVKKQRKSLPRKGLNMDNPVRQHGVGTHKNRTP